MYWEITSYTTSNPISPPFSDSAKQFLPWKFLHSTFAGGNDKVKFWKVRGEIRVFF
jgi:hypothetical protein